LTPASPERELSAGPASPDPLGGSSPPALQETPGLSLLAQILFLLLLAWAEPPAPGTPAVDLSHGASEHPQEAAAGARPEVPLRASPAQPEVFALEAVPVASATGSVDRVGGGARPTAHGDLRAPRPGVVVRSYGTLRRLDASLGLHRVSAGVLLPFRATAPPLA
jgi:hypothetical protein